MKHNKIKNTGLIFEILSRLVMRETLDNKSTALKIVRKHFKPNSNLVKELTLYQNLSHQTPHNPNELFEMTLKTYNTLDKKQLFQEKYDLVKDIKKNYNIDFFFQTKTSNYKVVASAYKLFEYTDKDDPNDYLTCKQLVLEHIGGKKIVENNEVEETVRDQDKDVRILSFKIIVEKFNEKYQTLNDRQKKLLQKYINEDIHNPTFKDYVLKEVDYITNTLQRLGRKLDDDITKIKLNETISLAQNIIAAKSIKEDHLNSMLKYYELIEELK